MEKEFPIPSAKVMPHSIPPFAGGGSERNKIVATN